MSIGFSVHPIKKIKITKPPDNNVVNIEAFITYDNVGKKILKGQRIYICMLWIYFIIIIKYLFIIRSHIGSGHNTFVVLFIFE